MARERAPAERTPAEGCARAGRGCARAGRACARAGRGCARSGRARPARARLPPRHRPAGDAGAGLGRAHAFDRRWDHGGDGGRGLLVLPRRPRADTPDPRGDERPRPLAGRQGQPGLGRGHHRAGRGIADADHGPGRDRRRAVRVGPRLRHRSARGHALGAARLARPGGRRAQRPDPRRPRLHRARDRVPPDDRRPPGRHRREGPADGRGRGPARPADRARRGAGRAPQRGDARAPDAAVGGPGVRRPAGGRGQPRPDRRGVAPRRRGSARPP